MRFKITYTNRELGESVGSVTVEADSASDAIDVFDFNHGGTSDSLNYVEGVEQLDIDVRPAIQKLRDAQMALAQAYDSFKELDPNDTFGLTGFTFDMHSKMSDTIEAIDAGEI